VKVQPYRQSILKQFKLDLDIVRSQGAYHHDAHGRMLLDGVAQYGALPFGHNPSALNAVVIDYLQAQRPNFIQPFVASSTTALASRLVQLAGPRYQQVVFTNSGTETVEAALKLSRLKTGRRAVLSTLQSFHGKTFAALSATGSERYSTPQIVDVEKFTKVPFNDLAALQAALETQTFAAFIIEPVQGEGGMRPANPTYLTEAERLCRLHGTLFVLDEIQTGLGRSGALLAAHRYGVEPDMLLLSKALGGGIMPLGAMILKRGVYHLDFDSKHSSTFANGGLACAVGVAVIDALLDERTAMLAHVKACEAVVTARFAALAKRFPDHFSYSGLGLMYALHFRDPCTQGNYIVSYAQKSDLLSLMLCGYLVHAHHVFCMPLLNNNEGGSIRFQPPLTVTLAEIERFLNAFETLCELLHGQRYDTLMRYLVSDTPQAVESLPAVLVPPPVRTLSPGPRVGGHVQFAFLMHPTSVEDVYRGLPAQVAASYPETHKRALAEWFFSLGDIEDSPEVVFEFSMESTQGAVVNGAMIYSPLSPQAMLRLNRADKAALMEKFLHKAGAVGAQVVGLGAYTSVISKGGLDIASAPFHLTTGNSLTAISSCRAIRDVFADTACRKRLMIVGARGSVGRLALMDLSTYFGRVDIVGSLSTTADDQYIHLRRALVEVRQATDGLPEGSAAGTFWTLCEALDLVDTVIDCSEGEAPALMRHLLATGTARGTHSFTVHVGFAATTVTDDLDCVYCATSEGKSFIRADLFPSTCKIFDVARPFDVLRGEACREIYEAGLVILPDTHAMLSDCNLIGCEPGVSLACLSETILLSMAGITSHHSLGKEIAYGEAKAVGDLATHHGFSHYLDRTRHVSA
jgi:acetylornithine/succinyldiaminopimelate/putrescine aminotransferase/predicted amino acid dehydrogenase